MEIASTRASRGYPIFLTQHEVALFITPLARGEAEKVAVQLTKSLSNVKFRSNIYLKNFFLLGAKEGLLLVYKA
jgi:hypothetical protein